MYSFFFASVLGYFAETTIFFLSFFLLCMLLSRPLIVQIFKVPPPWFLAIMSGGHRDVVMYSICISIQLLTLLLSRVMLLEMRFQAHLKMWRKNS